MPVAVPAPTPRQPEPHGPVTHVLFDLDGTLWDSAPGIVASLAHALGAVGVEVAGGPTLASNVGPPLLMMLEETGVPPDRLVEAKAAYRDHYRRVGELRCEVYPDAVGMLESLIAHGLRLATATSKGVEPTLRMLEHFELAGFFDVVAAAPMESAGHGKAEVIAEALDGLGQPERSGVVMVGDRHYDIDGGHAHGLRSVGVTWGYGSHEELTGSRPAALVDSFDALESLLLAGR